MARGRAAIDRFRSGCYLKHYPSNSGIEMRALLLALAWLSFANAADEIFLQSGKDIEGEIVEIGPVKTTIRNTRGITSTVPTSNIVAFKVNGRLVSGAPNPDSLVSYRQPAPGDSARPSQPAAPAPKPETATQPAK